MRKITERLRRTNGASVFHDSRQDVRTLIEYCNMLADKINELNDEVQELREKMKGG